MPDIATSTSSFPPCRDDAIAHEVESLQIEAVDAFGSAPVYVMARRLHVLGARLESQVRPLRYPRMLTELGLRAMLAMASAHAARDARTRRRYLARAHESVLRYRATLEAMADRQAIGPACLAVGMRLVRNALDDLAPVDHEHAVEPSVASSPAWPASAAARSPSNGPTSLDDEVARAAGGGDQKADDEGAVAGLAERVACNEELSIAPVHDASDTRRTRALDASIGEGPPRDTPARCSP